MELPSFHNIFFLKTRAKPQAYRQYLATLLAIFSSLWAINCQAQGYYSQAEVQTQAANFLTNHYANKGKIEVVIGNLDSRTQLPRCSQALTFKAQDTANSGGNISVQTQCKGSPHWSVHIPAQVRIFREVPVASHDIARGKALTGADISWETREISQFRQEYLTNTEEITGQEAKRNLGKGSLFLSSALSAPKVIKRGDQVALSSTVGGISVTTAGTAMSDGRLGQTIRVKNNQSTRIISGTVVAEGKVVTL